MELFEQTNSKLEHMFHMCTTEQIEAFIPVKKSFRIRGHSTTLRLEQGFWVVLEEMANEESLLLVDLIIKISDTCLVANDKNLASCLRVICLKYLNIYS
jgi:predicted DNA-binding ribbon-helix-helix protein